MTMIRPMLLAAILALSPAAASAEPTEVVVRVLSQGAKFVGSAMGGAHIVLRDAASGAILAEGPTSGSTGDTARIMAGGPRGTPLADAGAAAFRARLDIDRPLLVDIEAHGPTAQRQAAVRVTAQRWLLPGQPVIGDGWTLELPGLVVDAVEPAAHQRLVPGTASVRIGVNVAMMCGCPIEPGGLWDADRFDVRADIAGTASAAAATRLPLRYGGRTGYFTAELKTPASGDYVVTVSALDRQSGATGVDRMSFIVP